MKIKMLTLYMAALLSVTALTGCSVTKAEDRMRSAGEAVENRMESLAETLKQSSETDAVRPSAAAEPAITQAEAEQIALDHAGFAADRVSHLRTVLERDDGILEYDVEFYVGNQEYDYEIHAETGEILSWEKDD